MTVRLTRIYTKTGDAGQTHLGDMSRVPKTHPRIEDYGAVDELNAQIGLTLTADGLPEQYAAWLRRIQNDLFDVGADLSVPPGGERERLRVVAEPYAWADLKVARDQLTKAFGKQKWDVGYTAGIGCTMSDSWHVEVLLFKDSGKFITLATKVLAQRYGGDKVIVRRLTTAPPRVVSVSPGPVKKPARSKKKR